MTTYHKPQRDESYILFILVSVCALVVASLRPEWLAKPVKELIDGSGIRPDWLSRLKGKLLPVFIEAVGVALRRGRPPAQENQKKSSSIQEDLERVIETYTIKLASEKKKKVQEWLLGVYERLRGSYGIRLKEFCKRLGIAERTFRFWRSRGVEPAAPPPAPEPPTPARSRGEGRFDLEHTMPGIQQMADTTNWEVFGVNLKVVASQDPGDRKREPLSGFRVAGAESSKMVVELAQEVAEPGTQFITDRGTPYRSTEAEEGYEEKELEHVQCKEFTATEKATLERNFRTEKEALSPLVEFLNELARKIPALCCIEIAEQTGKLLLEVYRRVHSIGLRASPVHPLEGEDAEVLRCIADEQKDMARSDLRSKRATLERIHLQYKMAAPQEKFIRLYYSYALEDIKEAERRMRPAGKEQNIRKPDQYFAAIINDVADTNRPRRKKEQEERKRQAEKMKEERQEDARLEYLDSNPDALLHHGLDFLSCQWRNGYFFLNGLVSGGFLHRAVSKMAASDPLGFEDEALLECRRWHAASSPHDPPLQAIVDFVGRIIEDVKRTLVVKSVNRNALASVTT